jgi:hypothetical protein
MTNEISSHLIMFHFDPHEIILKNPIKNFISDTHVTDMHNLLKLK